MRFQPITFLKFPPSPHRLQLLIRTSARLLAVTLALIAASCSTSTQPTPSSPSTTDTQAASPLPLGIYTNDTLPSRSMTLTMLDGGRYTLKVRGLLFQGTWTLAQHEATFNLTEGGICIDKLGTYEWAFDGQSLTFTLVQDDCLTRTVDWPSGPWIIQP